MKILVIGNGMYVDFFKRTGWGEVTSDLNPIVEYMTGVDLVCFTGGADVDPEFYGEIKHSQTFSDPHRDMREARIFAKCLERGIPMVGICRGSQFLTVMCGGKLIQHVNGHAISDQHAMIVRDAKDVPRQFMVNSTHHQMMYPFNLDPSDYKVVGYSQNVAMHLQGLPTEEVMINALDPKTRKEPEIVYYKNQKCLAIQYHPETLDPNRPVVKMTKSLIEHYLFPS